ncbi:MAG TPA: cupin domain-containing protein [Ktedonobacterales bacterium]|nr:cupin domain-containing protein [Ktedonobacterales bacterium]
MDDNPRYMIDLLAVAETARTTGAPGVIWSLADSADLNVNLVRFVKGDGVEAHTNTEVDVVCLALAGDGYVIVDGAAENVRAGQLFFLPKGAERAIHAGPTEFVYLTCHRRRQGIMPTRRGG